MGGHQSFTGCDKRPRFFSLPHSFSPGRTTSTRRHGLSWKFWRSLSFRRNYNFRFRYKTREERHSDVTDYWRQNVGGLRSDLPDVLEDATCLKTDSGEQKSKRRSLFRSMSLIVSRNSDPDEKKEHRRAFSPRPAAQTDSPVKSTSSVDSLAKELSATNIQLVRNSYTMFSAEFYQPPLKTEQLDAESVFVEENKVVPLRKCLPNDIRASSPVRMSSVNTDTMRSKCGKYRNESLDKLVDCETYHKLILAHAHDLLCLRLQPSDVLYDLHAVGLLSTDDYIATENQVTLETFMKCLADESAHKFHVFLDVLRNSDGCEDLSVILDAMISVCDVIYKIPENFSNSTILEQSSYHAGDDDKKLFFDVGFLDSKHATLMPVVKLLKGSNEKRDKNNRANWFRLSVHSLASDMDITEYVSKQLCQLPMISVYLSGYNLHGERSIALARTLGSFNCILELNVGKSQLSYKDFDHICSALVANQSICSLDLRLNDVGDEGAARLGAFMRKSGHLRLLNISSNGIKPLGCKQLCQGLMINACLRDLDLSFVDIGDEGCVYLSDMLTKNCHITRLRLRNTNIGWAGCALIFESLTENRALEELDLSRNPIDNKGVEAMCLHLPRVSSLVDLNLENCGIKIEECVCFGSALRLNVSLKRLDLSANSAGDEGIDNLKSIVTETKSIESLGLNMCGITTAGFMAVLEALGSNRTITLLKLCYNRIGGDKLYDADEIRFRLHCVKSSKPKLKLLLWGNVLENRRTNNRDENATTSDSDQSRTDS